MLDGARVIYEQGILKIQRFLPSRCHPAARTLFITKVHYKECEENPLLSEREPQSGRSEGEQEESETVNLPPNAPWRTVIDAQDKGLHPAERRCVSPQ